MRSAGWLLTLSLVAGCGTPLASDPPAQGAPGAEPAPFESLYSAAATEYEVPVAVVRAMAFAQTGHHIAGGEAGSFGVMGLQGEILAEAAQRLGVPVARVESDPETNVRGAVAVYAARRADGLSIYQAALAVADLSSAASRSRWLIAFDRDLVAHAPDLAGAPPDTGTDPVFFGAADYPDATFVPASSSNYTAASRGPGDVTWVIIHDTEGSYASAINWFQNPSAQVSAHYVISEGGDITQMVHEKDIAWHAGNWSYNEGAVGIEHEGYASDPSSYPETQYVASAKLTRYLCDKYSVPIDRTHVIGHYQVPAPNTHTDPGPYWDWDHYMELVQQDGAPLTATLVGYVREGDIYAGAPIAGAVVTIQENGRSATTDADGYYAIDHLELGAYTVTAHADGYLDATDSKSVDTPDTYWKSLALDPVDGGMAGGGGGGGHGCEVGALPARGPGALGLSIPLAWIGLALVRRRH